MGEALITRRGGGFKVGKIANVGLHSIQDDNLIGAKNAIIKMLAQDGSKVEIENAAGTIYNTEIEMGGASGNSSWSVLAVRIADGVVTEVDAVDSKSYVGYGTYNGGSGTFDPTTGTITVGDKRWFVYYFANSDKVGLTFDYEYFIFN